MRNSRGIPLMGAAALLAAASLIVVGCDGLGGQNGTLTLNLSDAPTDEEGIIGVYITINEIEYNAPDGEGEDNWIAFDGFEGPEAFNLLELTGGEFALLGSMDLPAGQYNQIRFMLDIPTQGSDHANPGCYISFDDDGDEEEDRQESLFVPSGGQSGYKATGEFTVPVNGTVEITADFDVRKAVVTTGSGRYILKPTIKLVVNNEAGSIILPLTNDSTAESLVVYAYEDGAYVDTQADEPVAEEPRFPDAVATAAVNDEGNFVLAFLAEDTYDLVVAGLNQDGDFVEVLGFISDVSVTAGENTTLGSTGTNDLETEL